MITRKQFPSLLAPYCVAREVSAGAVVFRVLPNDVRQFLLLQYRAGHWEFPRGHMQKGETETEAALREIREETGLANVRLVPGVRATTQFSYLARGAEYQSRKNAKVCAVVWKRVIFFAAEVAVDADVQISDEHIDYLWADYTQAIATLTFRNARGALSTIVRDLDQKSRTAAV